MSLSDKITRPFLDRGPSIAVRDPAVCFHKGLFHCFHTAVENRSGTWELALDVVRSSDLEQWDTPRRLASGQLNFSSPGNVIRHQDRWFLCLQSYPVNPGETYGSEDSRLWLMTSDDLEKWTSPAILQPEGAKVSWSGSPRQIDPYLTNHEGKHFCFYKTAGQLGLLVSSDLKTWEEASPSRPVLGIADTPDGSTVENPCVVRDGNEFVLFFSPCRKGRGVGVARSSDLLYWSDVRYLDFPSLPWAPGGPTAAMVLDTREGFGSWTMFFHGDKEGPHDAALGLAYSNDLEHWRESVEP